MREHDRAAMLARTEMNELLALDRPAGPGNKWRDRRSQFRWRATITPWKSRRLPPAQLARIELEIAFGTLRTDRKQVQIEGFLPCASLRR
ncbi:MAG: hypothetical protein R2724_26175 [Bryobacterales bacterium]